MKVSARNVLPGTVVGITKGPMNTLVRIEIAPGVVVSAMVTTEAIAELGLAEGKRAYAVMKASSILVGVD
ncbi:MAG: TOBE domain-containing protein [Burkholderiales bacterium]